jgi:hypothetical protein
MALVLANGRYLTIRFDKQTSPGSGRAASSAKLLDRGACKFDKAKQIENCDLSAPGEQGDGRSGKISARYTTEADGTLKARMGADLEGSNGGGSSAFDVFPVRCPDSVVHELILSVLPTP